MIDVYESLRCEANRGQVELVSEELRKWRESEKPAFLQRLISARLALRSGNIKLDADHWIVEDSWPAFFQAEGFLLKGFIHFYSGQYALGVPNFQKAEALFLKSNCEDRALIAAYNVVIGRENEQEFTEKEQLNELVRLQRRAVELKNSHLKGLILRQKSYALTMLGRFSAASREIEKALEPLEMYGSKSDFELALIQAAFCEWKCGRDATVECFLQRLLEPIDERVGSALSVLQSMREKKPIDTKKLGVLSPYWKNLAKFWGCDVSDSFENGQQMKAQFVWSQVDQVLKNLVTDQEFTLKRRGLEAQLLNLLAGGGCSKALICERLWPEACLVETLDNRLHRLVSRINKKFENIVGFDGTQYYLCCEVS